MKIIIICISVLIFTSACDLNENNRKTSQTLVYEEINKDSSNYIIAAYNTSLNTKHETYKVATLSQKEILLIDSILHVSITEWNSDRELDFIEYNKQHPSNKKEKNNMFINLIDYKRQYTPVVNDKNEKEVWVYCACDGNFGLVQDGGKCYFELIINLTNKTHTNIGINSMG
ncbi:MAG: hypothetical protein V4667_05215 [Bacteroidota bacterium]